MQYITRNIIVSSDILETLSEPYNQEKLLSIANSLARDYENLHSRELAGRIYMYVKLRGAPKTIEAYVSALSKRLRGEIKKFLLQNADFFNKVLREREGFNYLPYDYFSAVKKCQMYLLSQGPDRPCVETPVLMDLRVATELYWELGRDKVYEKFLEMNSMFYTHASPCLFNSGTPNPQMGSCFLLGIGDNLESIVNRGIADASMISKNMGGLGIDLSRIRHSVIGYCGKSSGVLPFAKVIDQAIASANQGGRRNGAVTLFLKVWHLDIEDFVRACASIGSASIRFDNATGCVWSSDLFFERVRNDQEWTLFCPSHVENLVDLYNQDFEEKYIYFENLALQRAREHSELKKRALEARERYEADPDNDDLKEEACMLGIQEVEFEKKYLIEYKRISAKRLYQEIVISQLRRSVYIMNGDKINATCNMCNIGPVNCSNLCLEIIEPCNDKEIASCNLASINLKVFCRGKIDWQSEHHNLQDIYDFQGLFDASRSCVENLNRVIDKNNYPLDHHTAEGHVNGPISVPNKKNRPIGLGVSGLNDAYLNCDLIYSSETAGLMNKMIFSTMYFGALCESVRMAIEDGEYSTFRTGTSKLFIDGKWTTLNGSPFSNGYFQFDLWKFHREYLRTKGRLIEMSRDQDENDSEQDGSDYDIYGLLPGEKLYDVEDDKELDPVLWGIKPFSINTYNRDGLNVRIVIEPTWDSLRQAVMKYGLRNSMFLALMPTASTADLLRNTETTEAHQQLVYTRSVGSGNFVVIVPQLQQDLTELGIWSNDLVHFINACGGSIKYIHKYVKDFHPDFNNWDRLEYLQLKHKCMFEISQKTVMQQTRQRGIYVDQSQSLNIFIARPNSSILEKVHQYSTALGLKTNIYYLRQAPDIESKKLNLPHHIRHYYDSICEQNEETPVVEEQKEEEEPVQFCTMEGGCISCSV